MVRLWCEFTSDICDRYRKNKDIEETNNENAEDNIPIDDTWRSRIQEWLGNIAVRNSVFNDFYPFTVGHDSIQLKDNLTNAHKIYIFRPCKPDCVNPHIL